MMEDDKTINITVNGSKDDVRLLIEAFKDQYFRKKKDPKTLFMGNLIFTKFELKYKPWTAIHNECYEGSIIFKEVRNEEI